MLKAIDIFGEWAKEGRDVGMEKAHEISVNEMIDFALEERANIGAVSYTHLTLPTIYSV